jgi:hypothetical protein
MILNPPPDLPPAREQHIVAASRHNIHIRRIVFLGSSVRGTTSRKMPVVLALAARRVSNEN